MLSTDPAHSLADAFDVPLGPLPVEVATGLWGQQLDAQERMEEAWADIQGWLREVFAWAGVDGLEAEELSVIPGLDEIFALADIRARRVGEWDVVVVDCAPTAETLRLLSLPDILSWYMERLFPVGRRVNKVLAPVLSRVTSLPMADDSVFAATSAFYDRLDGVREILTDPARTSVRLVVNPERMVIAEARRTYTYLSLFGYRVDAVVANRLLPDAVADPWFERVEGGARRAPQGHRGGVRAGAGAAGRRWRPRSRSASSACGASATAARRPAVHRRAEAATAMVLRLSLPGADKDDLELAQHDDELLVRVGPYRRAMVLPDSLRRRTVSDATLDDDVLTVRSRRWSGPSAESRVAGMRRRGSSTSSRPRSS